MGGGVVESRPPPKGGVVESRLIRYHLLVAPPLVIINERPLNGPGEGSGKSVEKIERPMSGGK